MKGGVTLLKIFQILFLIITIAIAGYGLFTNDFQFHVYMSLFLGLVMLVLGMEELKRNRKFLGWMLIGVFAFSMIVVIQRFRIVST